MLCCGILSSYVYLLFWGGGEGRSLGASHVALVVKNLPANARDMRLGFDRWVRKIPWRRAWQPTPVFLPTKSHCQRSLVGYSPWNLSWIWLKWLSTHEHIHKLKHNFNAYIIFLVAQNLVQITDMLDKYKSISRKTCFIQVLHRTFNSQVLFTILPLSHEVVMS